MAKDPATINPQSSMVSGFTSTDGDWNVDCWRYRHPKSAIAHLKTFMDG